VEQEIDHKKQLSFIINNPDSLGHSDIPLLRELVELYPYFQPLRLILAKLAMETEEAEQTLTTTALYTNGAMLHQFLHRKSVVQPIVSMEAQQQPPAVEEAAFEDKSIFDEATTLEAASLLEEVYAFGAADPEQPEEINSVEEVNDVSSDDQATYEEISEINIHDYDQAASPEDQTSSPARSEQLGAEDNDALEIFEEISEVDGHDYESPAAETHLASQAPVIETLEDNFVENIAATDFFTFEEKFIADDKVQVKNQETEDPASVNGLENNSAKAEHVDPSNQGLSVHAAPAWAKQQIASEKDTSEITNYDDDTLPYTFLWWLAKTRKEHSTIFQPYATPKKQMQSELHQQYVEHIFHIQSPFNAEEILNNVPEHQADPKDAKIIDEFIKKDPQITPPKPEQIDTENKAKRSAEDHNDLVSETLAKIYIEQMLYHKAIDTYEKLSLKFPEKSRYFADLIQSIKKKI
jgi:hypothetical protein